MAGRQAIIFIYRRASEYVRVLLDRSTRKVYVAFDFLSCENIAFLTRSESWSVDTEIAKKSIEHYSWLNRNGEFTTVSKYIAQRNRFQMDIFENR